MTIAVNTRFLLKDYLEGYGNFLYESFRRIVQLHPEHTFIFIFDRPYDERFAFEKNVQPVVAGPAARHPLLWKYWYDVKIPAVLRKYKADVFVSCDGFCSLTTKVPQCLLVHDLAFLHFPAAIKKMQLHYYRKFTPKCLHKATVVATVSGFSRQDIVTAYGLAPEKIDVVYNGVKSIFRPAAFEVNHAVKQQYTDGKEFFLYAGAIHPRKNLLNLLKAFSLFKKRQQTGMKLVLAGRLAWQYDSFLKSLQSYKYRNDVVLTGYIEEQELAKLMAAAYALVYPSFFEGFGVPVVEAMQCEVPVITTASSAMQEIAGEAALYTDPHSPADIAEKMMLLYKDENLRKDLIGKGKPVALSFTWDRTAALLWQSICKAIG